MLQTEEDILDSEPELPNQDGRSHKSNTKETKTGLSEPSESNHDDLTQNSDTELLNQKEFLERLHRLSNLKRKTEEFVHNNFYNADITRLEKRPKFKDKSAFNSFNTNHILQSNNFDHIHNKYEEGSTDVTPPYIHNISPKVHKNIDNITEYEEKNKLEQTITSNGPIECKTECEDSDTNVTSDPALCLSPQSLDERQKGPINYQTVQDSKYIYNHIIILVKAYYNLL